MYVSNHNIIIKSSTVLLSVLFAIYTDVLRAGSSKSTVIKFADDTVLLGYISDPGIDNEV